MLKYLRVWEELVGRWYSISGSVEELALSVLRPCQLTASFSTAVGAKPWGGFSLCCFIGNDGIMTLLMPAQIKPITEYDHLICGPCPLPHLLHSACCRFLLGGYLFLAGASYDAGTNCAGLSTCLPDCVTFDSSDILPEPSEYESPPKFDIVSYFLLL